MSGLEVPLQLQRSPGCSGHDGLRFLSKDAIILPLSIYVLSMGLDSVSRLPAAVQKSHVSVDIQTEAEHGQGPFRLCPPSKSVTAGAAPR